VREEQGDGAVRVSRGRALWNYVWLCSFNLVLFVIAGISFAFVARPLAEDGPWIVAVFAVGGAAWGGWSAWRANRGVEPV
jgi:hypothetical protein